MLEGADIDGRAPILLTAVLATIAVTVAISYCASDAAGSHWPMEQGDAQRTGQCSVAMEGVYGYLDATVETDGFVTGDMLVWQYGRPVVHVREKGIFTLSTDLELERVTVMNGDSYGTRIVVGNDDILYLVDETRLTSIAPSGVVRWVYDAKAAIHSSPVVGDDGTIYMGLSNKEVQAVTTDGDLAWSWLPEGYQQSEVTLDNVGRVYVAGNGLTAMEPNGTIIWQAYADFGTEGPATVGPDGTVHVVTSGASDYLRAVDRNGTELWQVGVGHESTSPVSVGGDGTVYISYTTGPDGRMLLAIDPDGTELWRTSTRADHRNAPIIDGNGNLLLHGDSAVEAFSHDGVLLWTFEDEEDNELLWVDKVQSVVIGTDGRVYVVSNSQHIYVLGDGFTLYDERPLGGGGPADSPCPQMHGGAHHNNVFDRTADGVDGTVVWHYDTGMYHWQAITIAPNGTLYVVAATAASTFDEVHAVTAGGQGLWVYRTLDDIVGSPSVSSEGLIVVNLWKTGVVGLDPRGMELWTYRLDGWMTGSPLIGDGGIIIVTTGNGTVMALNPDGSPRWSRNLGMRLVSSPVLGPGGRVYISTEDRELISIGTGGEVHWMVEYATNPIVYEHGIGPWTTAPPVVGPQGNVYITMEQSLYVIDADGNPLWDYQVNSLPSDKGGSYLVNYLETPAVTADGTVYVAARSGAVHVIASDGERVRTIDTREAVDAPAVLGANGTLIVSHNNNSVAYHPNGTVAWSFRMYDRYLDHYLYDECYVAPCVAADGVVYVTFANFGVYALGAGAAEEEEDPAGGDDGGIDRSWLITGSIVFLLLSGFMFTAFAVMNNTPEAREERRKRKAPPPPPPEPPYAYQVPPLHSDPGSETVQGYVGEPWSREGR